MLRAVGGLTKVRLLALTLSTLCEVAVWVVVLDVFAGVAVDFAAVFLGVGFLAIDAAVSFEAEGEAPAVPVAVSLIPGSSRQARIAARRIKMFRNCIA
jgi:hypothetical protein